MNAVINILDVLLPVGCVYASHCKANLNDVLRVAPYRNPHIALSCHDDAN